MYKLCEQIVCVKYGGFNGWLTAWKGINYIKSRMLDHVLIRIDDGEGETQVSITRITPASVALLQLKDFAVD